jgi:hypothetical protein
MHSKSGPRQPPELVRFFFHCRKLVEITGAQIRRIEWVWHPAHAMFFEPICWSPICINWAIVKMNDKSFLMRRPCSRKDHLFKWNEYVCHKRGSVHFGIIWESVDNREATDFHMIVNMKFLPWIWNLGFVITSSLNRAHMRHGYVFKKPRHITRHKMMPTITFGSIQEW